jgi:hypothetical protein
MSADNFKFEPDIEKALDEIREEAIDPAVIEAARARVWTNLSGAAQSRPVDHIRTCADFQALIPDYKANRLPESRAMLVKDHVNACVACRRVYEGKVVAFPGTAAQQQPKRSLWSTNPTFRWATAAMVVVGTGLSGWYVADRLGMFNQEVPAIVQAVNGTLYRVSAGGLQPLGVGQDLPDGVEIRTAKDSGAVVRLRDGSILEMRERSGFTTSHAGRDLTVRLGQGSVIVQAAKRRSGHLYVSTNDCRVAVTGTVFGVSAGMKGSRVSVVEGEVHVSQQSGEKVLRSGDQVTTSTSVAAVRVQDDVAWSRNYETYLGTLKQMQAIEKSLNDVRFPDLRYSSKILGKLPADVVLFASIPNLGNYFAEAQQVFRERINESPQLKAWLERDRGLNMEIAVSKLQQASGYFGDEVVIVALKGEAGSHMRGPVFLAEEKKPGLNDFIRANGGELRVEARGGLIAMSPDKGAAAALLDGMTGQFSTMPLYTRVAEAYHNGAGLLFAADFAGLATHEGPVPVQYLMGEQKQTAARTDVRAVVGFKGERKGFASWLAAPGPMGGLQYVSPEATFVAAFVVKTPAAIVDELLAIPNGSSEKSRAELAKLQAELGIDVRNDLAASLGGEFAVALDGPVFPVPAWRMVVETYDSNRLQFSISKLVEAYNREAVKHGKPAIRYAQETVNGRAYFLVGTADQNPLTEAHYTFSDGYMIAAPSRALVDRALQVRTNGVGIIRSTSFLSLLPRDRYANCSGLIYQNLGTTLAPLAGLLGSFANSNPDAAKQLGQIGNMKPMLVAVYGEADRIEMAGTGEQFRVPIAALLSGNLSGLAGFPTAGRKAMR